MRFGLDLDTELLNYVINHDNEYVLLTFINHCGGIILVFYDYIEAGFHSNKVTFGVSFVDQTCYA